MHAPADGLGAEQPWIAGRGGKIDVRTAAARGQQGDAASEMAAQPLGEPMSGALGSRGGSEDISWFPLPG
ncbi:MAG: hypothetical protein VB141_02450 [Burkholderia gladioli]